MAIHTEVQTLNFRKEVFTIKQRFYLCEYSGERFTSTQLDELNLSLVYNAYRAKHHILSPEEIKETREKYGLSATPSIRDAWSYQGSNSDFQSVICFHCLSLK
mgnify:CR=1 FL=1